MFGQHYQPLSCPGGCGNDQDSRWTFDADRAVKDTGKLPPKDRTSTLDRIPHARAPHRRLLKASALGSMSEMSEMSEVDPSSFRGKTKLGTPGAKVVSTAARWKSFTAPVTARAAFECHLQEQVQFSSSIFFLCWCDCTSLRQRCCLSCQYRWNFGTSRGHAVIFPPTVLMSESFTFSVLERSIYRPSQMPHKS